MPQKNHWEQVYTTKPSDRVSWFQEHAARSLKLIQATAVPNSAKIIDVGGGASTLVDDLLNSGYTNITVLDLSATALELVKQRLGTRSIQVQWLEADITAVQLPTDTYDVWHDRAVFHFLTTPQERQAYVEVVCRSVKPGGHVIISTFAEDGPSECSGLPIVRYTPSTLHREFGAPFTLINHENEAHQTPWGTIQKFIYCYFRKRE
jgi:2-polyprenyl-3-methyl-5-hydroxy-6-metoxy-1,4-benzoquinol methylase